MYPAQLLAFVTNGVGIVVGNGDGVEVEIGDCVKFGVIVGVADGVVVDRVDGEGDGTEIGSIGTSWVLT
jgi:hypothetical protein